MKKKGKRKGLGGLSPEKKKMLKKLIMQKAAEDLRNEAKKKAEEKEKHINDRVEPLKVDGLSQGGLRTLCKELQKKYEQLEADVYDWEFKIREKELEINDLTVKVNDTKGKFMKPVLRKVNKTESKFSKLERKENRDFRGNLKSTGQNKYKLEEEETSKTPDWRNTLKGKEEGGEHGEEES
ncbi:hypothetical protein LOTGIDRAFT_200673 [Lottia gigantea]|uniref:Troponin I n=1 Tax=Lottia gigantea TaxID=225164 RepID=V4B2S6_LOTGI|nr:hypothetical protein LOTGIDRAFT_200673 [Lottia gigantea]ESP00797.1 hypothetical protein LOTGIDRAFT_200673 [Lottia gigantea]